MVSRREFLQNSALGIGALWLSRKLLADELDPSSVPPSDNCETTTDTDFLSWSPATMGDILFLGGGFISDKMGEGLAGRAYIAFLIKVPQAPTRYVTKVVLTDSSLNKLGTRYLDPSDRLSSGFPNYMIFNNINLTADDRYFLYIQMKLDGVYKNFRFPITKSDLSKHILDGNFLPARLRTDLRNAPYANFFSTPFWYKSNGMIPSQHVVRARLLSVTQDSNFQLQISFPAPDKDAEQYQRYFFATDPVGRLLGLAYRKFGDPSGAYLILTALTAQQVQDWGIISENVAKIRECPYILVFVDDAKEALSMGTLWLR